MKTSILITVAGLLLSVVLPSVVFNRSSPTVDRDAMELVGRLATAERVLSIYSDGHAPHFSIVSRSGVTLGKNLDEAAFQRDFPDLYRDFSEGIAGLHAGLGDHYQGNHYQGRPVSGVGPVPGF